MLFGVVALAFALRLAWIATLGDSITWDDEQEFAAVARHLAAGDGFVSTSYRANPILPAYLAVIFRVFGENFFAARIGQAAFGALTCMLVFLIARRLFNVSVATVSALLIALYPPHIYLSGVFYVECLFTLTIAATVYLALRATEATRPDLWAILTGISFGIATLTRSVFVVYLPFLIAALLYAEWPHARRALRCAVLVVLGAAVTIAPWSIRMSSTYGRPILVSSGFGTKLWQGNNEMARGDADDRELYWATDTWDERARELDPEARALLTARYATIGAQVDALEAQLGDRYLATDTVLTPIATRWIAEHPGRAAVLFVKKVVTLFAPFSKTITQNEYTTPRYHIIAGLSYVPLLMLAVAGIWLERRGDRRLPIVYALLGSIIVAYGILNTCTRFRLPLDPFLMMFSAVALVRMGEAWLGRDAGRPGDLTPTRA